MRLLTTALLLLSSFAIVGGPVAACAADVAAVCDERVGEEGCPGDDDRYSESTTVTVLGRATARGENACSPTGARERVDVAAGADEAGTSAGAAWYRDADGHGIAVGEENPADGFQGVQWSQSGGGCGTVFFGNAVTGDVGCPAGAPPPPPSVPWGHFLA